jgi:hypothetical protein
MDPFRASGTQIGVSFLLVAAIAAAAFLFFRPSAPGPAAPPSPHAARGFRPWTLGLLTFACGSAYHFVNYGAGTAISPVVIVSVQFALIAFVLVTVGTASRSPFWTDANVDAVATGALLVYCWWGFALTYKVHGTSTLAGQCFPAGVILALLLLRRSRGAARRAA